MIALKDIKRDVICRVGSVLSLLSTGMSHPSSVEVIRTTNQGFKLEAYGTCRLGENQPTLVAYFRDEPGQRRGIAFGFRKQDVEVFSYSQNLDDIPAEQSYEFRTGIRDLFGNSILLEPGTAVTVSAYPAKKSADPEDRFKIAELRTSLDPLASQEVTMPYCTPS